jgi:CHAT domain-containing protein
VAGGEEEQQRFFAASVSPYREIVDLLTSEKQPELALVYAERAKGRVLLDVLRGGRVKITKAMTSEEMDSEEKLEQQIFTLNSRIAQLSNAENAGAQSLDELKNQLEKARLQYSDFQTRLYARHPELQARRGETRPISLKEASALLPDKHTAFIEFVVGAENVDLFVLTKTDAPDSSAAALMTYSIHIGAEELGKKTDRFRQQLEQRDLAFQSSALELYHLLLKPVEQQLKGKSSLLIIPDGALWELPFQALRTANNRYLLEDADIAYVPSLTVLREMNHLQRSEHAPVVSGSPDLLAMGNPSLGRDTSERAKLVYRGASLDPLPEAAQEVKMLERLYGPDRSKVYIGSEAREDRFKQEAGKFRVLHLASHGIFNDTDPMYSHILLSAGDAGGNEDGLLEAWEIMQLDLKADLAVLSACETARGRVSPGEGVIGLTWAFFVAGVPTTLVSQWKVESSSTSKLMLAFHRTLANGDKQIGFPFRTARALQLAELQLLHSQQYTHPFYWAGFVLVGDPH